MPVRGPLPLSAETGKGIPVDIASPAAKAHIEPGDGVRASNMSSYAVLPRPGFSSVPLHRQSRNPAFRQPPVLFIPFNPQELTTELHRRQCRRPAPKEWVRRLPKRPKVAEPIQAETVSVSQSVRHGAVI